MSTDFQKTLTKRGTHGVFYFTSIGLPRQIDGGAKCFEDMDNGELVEMYFDPTNDETPIIKPLSNVGKKGLLLYSPEVLHFADFETKLDFHNGKGDMANVYNQETLVTFKTSKFEVVDADKTIDDVKRGWYAYYVLKTESKPAHYALTATKPVADKGVNVYEVFNVSTDDNYELLGQDMIELQVPSQVPLV